MAIIVCPLSKLSKLVKAKKPDRVVSILDPGSTFPKLGAAYVGRHLRLEFHDIHFPTQDYVLPSATHIDRLLRFLDRWDPQDSLLIHCRAGIGRSTATAYIAACYHNPDIDELKIAAQLRLASTTARPNKTLIRIADNAMARNGRMVKAVESSLHDLPWLDVAEGEPFQIPSTYSGNAE